MLIYSLRDSDPESSGSESATAVNPNSGHSLP